MPSERARARRNRINSGLVRQEVVVDREGGGDRATLLQLAFDGGLTEHHVALLGLVLVGREWIFVRLVHARTLALRRARVGQFVAARLRRVGLSVVGARF